MMARFFLWIFLCFSIGTSTLLAQPGIKRKKVDTSSPILKRDSTITKLVAFKDSLAKVGPGSNDIPKPEDSDTTWLTLLMVGSVLLVVWAGRRAWIRRRGQ